MPHVMPKEGSSEPNDDVDNYFYRPVFCLIVHFSHHAFVARVGLFLERYVIR